MTGYIEGTPWYKAWSHGNCSHCSLREVLIQSVTYTKMAQKQCKLRVIYYML